MATWTLTGTGLPISASGSNLTGSIPLSGAQPADFPGSTITEIRVIRTFTVSGIGDDNTDEATGCEMVNGNAQTVFQSLGSTVNRTADGSFPATITSTGQPVNGPTATGNSVKESSVRGWWAQFNANMKNDGGTLSITALTVEIDYNPPLPTGNAAISGSGAIAAVGGSRSVSGAANVTATGAIASSGGPLVVGGVAAVTGVGVLAASGYPQSVAGGAHLIDGPGSITVTGAKKATEGNVVVTAVGSLAAAGSARSSGSADLTQPSFITVTGVAVFEKGNAALTATGDIVAGGYARPFGSAVLTATGTLAADGGAVVAGAAALSAVGTIQTSGLGDLGDTLISSQGLWLNTSMIHNGQGYRDDHEIWNGSRWVLLNPAGAVPKRTVYSSQTPSIDPADNQIYVLGTAFHATAPGYRAIAVRVYRRNSTDFPEGEVLEVALYEGAAKRSSGFMAVPPFLAPGWLTVWLDVEVPLTQDVEYVACYLCLTVKWPLAAGVHTNPIVNGDLTAPASANRIATSPVMVQPGPSGFGPYGYFADVVARQ